MSSIVCTVSILKCFVDSSVWEKWYDQDEGARFSHLRSSTSELQDTIEKSELNTKELAAEKIAKSDTSEIETTTGLKDDKSEEQNLLGDEITINLDIDSNPLKQTIQPKMSRKKK